MNADAINRAFRLYPQVLAMEVPENPTVRELMEAEAHLNSVKEEYYRNEDAAKDSEIMDRMTLADAYLSMLHQKVKH